MLIHGVLSDSRPLCNWGFLLRDKAVSAKLLGAFQVYIYRYPSLSADLAKEGLFLRIALQKLCQQGRGFYAICSSLGGNLLCEALQEDFLAQSFLGGISLSSPFLGTPILNAELYPASSPESLLLKSINAFLPGLRGFLSWSRERILPAALLERTIRYGVRIEDPFAASFHYKHLWNAFLHTRVFPVLSDASEQFWTENDGLVPVSSSLLLSPSELESILLTGWEGLEPLRPRLRLLTGLNHSQITDLDAFGGRRLRPVIDSIAGTERTNVAAYIWEDLEGFLEEMGSEGFEPPTTSV